MQKSENCWGWN